MKKGIDLIHLEGDKLISDLIRSGIEDLPWQKAGEEPLSLKEVYG